MKILAVDPGKMTGWAYINFGPEHAPLPIERLLDTPDFLQAGEYPWFEFLDKYQEWMLAGHIDVTVSESFTITRETLKKTRQNWSLEAIGVMRFLSGQWGSAFVLQSPGQAKSFATKEKLEKMGWWIPGKDHAQDACRHLLTYAASHPAELGFDLAQIL